MWQIFVLDSFYYDKKFSWLNFIRKFGNLVKHSRRRSEYSCGYSSHYIKTNKFYG
jgi:hypothetical protein